VSRYILCRNKGIFWHGMCDVHPPLALGCRWPNSEFGHKIRATYNPICQRIVDNCIGRVQFKHLLSPKPKKECNLGGQAGDGPSPLCPAHNLKQFTWQCENHFPFLRKTELHWLKHFPALAPMHGGSGDSRITVV
jgi:hypothetical protein